MGKGFSRLFCKNKDNVNILVVGLGYAGKTKLLSQLNESGITQIPKYGVATQSTSFSNVVVTSTEFGGRCGTRSLHRHYYQMTDAVIFMLDSTLFDELDYTKVSLKIIATQKELADIPLLVLANKQDLPEARSIQDIEEELEMKELKMNKEAMEILPVSALTGEGISAAFEWIQHQLQLKQMHQAVVKPVQKAVPPCLATFYTSVSSAIKQALGSVKAPSRPSTSP